MDVDGRGEATVVFETKLHRQLFLRQVRALDLQTAALAVSLQSPDEKCRVAQVGGLVLPPYSRDRDAYPQVIGAIAHREIEPQSVTWRQIEQGTIVTRSRGARDRFAIERALPARNAHPNQIEASASAALLAAPCGTVEHRN